MSAPSRPAAAPERTSMWGGRFEGGPAEALARLCWFDAAGYRLRIQQPMRNRWVQGGVRDRAFFAARPGRAPESGRTCAADEGREDEQAGGAAHQQQLPHGVGADEELAERVVDGEQQHAEQHHGDAPGSVAGRRLPEAPGAHGRGRLGMPRRINATSLPPSASPYCTASW